MNDGTSTAFPETLEWVRDRLATLERDKSDRAVVKSEVKRLEGLMNAVAGEASRSHCSQEGTLAALQTQLATVGDNVRGHDAEIKGAYKWLLRSLMAIVVFLVTVAGGFVWYLAGMSFAIRTHGVAIQEINKKLEAQAAPKLDLAPLQAMMQQTATQAAAAALKQSAPPPAPVSASPRHR
jgi:hypothetical protein